MKYVIAFALVLGACKKGHKLELGPVATPFGPTKVLHFGMTPKELNALLPDFAFYNTSPPSWGGDYDVEGTWNLISSVNFDDGHASEIRLEIQHPEFVDDIVKAWGPGIDVPGLAEHTNKRYFNEAAGTRADLTEFHTVELYPYRPAAKVLDGPDPWSVMGVKILDRPVADVVAELERQGCYVDKKESEKDSVAVTLPANEWSAGDTGLVLRVGANGNVDRWTLGLADRKATEAAKAPLAQLFEKKWGKPRAIEHEGDAYGTAPGALVRDAYLQVASHPAW